MNFVTFTHQPEVISLPDIGVELLPVGTPELVGRVGTEVAIVALPPLQGREIWNAWETKISDSMGMLVECLQWEFITEHSPLIKL